MDEVILHNLLHLIMILCFVLEGQSMYSGSLKKKDCASDHVCSGTLWTGNFPAQDMVHQRCSDPLETGKPAVHGSGLE